MGRIKYSLPVLKAKMRDLDFRDSDEFVRAVKFIRRKGKQINVSTNDIKKILKFISLLNHYYIHLSPLTKEAIVAYRTGQPQPEIQFYYFAENLKIVQKPKSSMPAFKYPFPTFYEAVKKQWSQMHHWGHESKKLKREREKFYVDNL